MKAGLMLGVNPDATREVNDYYATDPNAIYVFQKGYKGDPTIKFI